MALDSRSRPGCCLQQGSWHQGSPCQLSVLQNGMASPLEKLVEEPGHLFALLCPSWPPWRWLLSRYRWERGGWLLEESSKVMLGSKDPVSYPLPLGFRHGTFGRTEVWGVEWDKCGCPDAWDCFTCLLVLCLSAGSAEGISLPKQWWVRGGLAFSLG